MTPDPRAWRVAIALAGDADWARWARGETEVTCPVCEGQGGDLAHRECGPCEACNGDGRVTLDVAVDFGWSAPTHGALTPVPAPWDAAAYLSDAARRGVEPGPLPSLEWADADGVGWRVSDGLVTVTFVCGVIDIATWRSDRNVIAWHNPIVVRTEIVGHIYTGATAAAKAMVP